MQVSSKNLSKEITNEVNGHLALALCELNKMSDAKQFLNDFLTSTERVVLSKRLAIGLLLHKKVAYEEIKKILNVSSATISGVSAMMKEPGFRMAIEKINQEQWAEAQLQKLTKFFRK